MSGAIPITILAGYLGAGKTQFINQCLSTLEDGRGLAILVNDFGELNIDETLLRTTLRDSPAFEDQALNDTIIPLSNGCVCCAIADDFTRGLEQLRDLQVNRVWLEASGVAEPDKLRRRCEYPGFTPTHSIVMADASRWPSLSRDRYVGSLVQRQLMQADLIVSNRGTGGEIKIGVPVVQQAGLSTQAQLGIMNDTKGASRWIAELLQDPAAHGTEASRTDDRNRIESPRFTSRTISPLHTSSETELRQLLQDLSALVVRAKGFVMVEEMPWLCQVTDASVTCQPGEAITTTDAPGLVCIVISEKLDPFDAFVERAQLHTSIPRSS